MLFSHVYVDMGSCVAAMGRCIFRVCGLVLHTFFILRRMFMDTLTLQETKEYLKMIFDLETALYKHDELVKGYTALRAQETPIKPERKSPRLMEMPKRPGSPFFIGSRAAVAGSRAWAKFLPWMLAGCISLALGLALISENLVIGIAGIVGFLFFFSVYFIGFARADKHDKQEQQEYKKVFEEAIKRWEELCEEVKKENDRIATEAEQEYSRRLQAYKTDVLAPYQQTTDAQLAEFAAVRQQLTATLERLYGQNILYAKYCNFVAVATIYEYFESGRCSELEGPNGAYNLYESELRANIIIGSLERISSSLEQIKSGQYALYQQIHESSTMVHDMLGKIHDTQVLTAYYARATALALSADRFFTA